MGKERKKRDRMIVEILYLPRDKEKKKIVIKKDRANADRKKEWGIEKKETDGKRKTDIQEEIQAYKQRDRHTDRHTVRH